MAQWILAALGIATALGNLWISAYYYGRLIQKVSAHGESILRLDDETKDLERKFYADSAEQWRSIGKMSTDIAKIQGRMGVNGTHH